MNPLQTIVYWKMFWLRLILSNGAIISAAICAGLAGVDNWKELETTQQIIVVSSILSVICINTVSLLDKTYASLSSGGKSLGDSNGGGGNGGSPAPSQPTIPPSLGLR